MTRAGAHPFPKQLEVVSKNTFLSTIPPQKYEGSLNNGNASMGSSLIGAVNASTGGSKLVGASSLTGNTTNNKNCWFKQGQITYLPHYFSIEFLWGSAPEWDGAEHGRSDQQ
jgi:hypothetical protein